MCIGGQIDVIIFYSILSFDAHVLYFVILCAPTVIPLPPPHNLRSLEPSLPPLPTLLPSAQLCRGPGPVKNLRSTNQKVCHTDKKENKFFLIYQEIQSGAVAKSYMRKGFLICEKMRKYFPIYEEAVSYI
jgi:hypothetical protein